MRILKLTLLILISYSCKNNHFNPGKSQHTQSKYNESNRYFEKKPVRYFYAYDTSRGKIENFDNGYVDTFSVNGIKFQLFSNPDSTGDLELQVLKNGKWQTNLKLTYGINGNEANRDVNGDGINDFILSLLRGSEVYLFDTFANEFHRESIGLAFEWSIIDSTKGIYSNNYSNRNFWNTDLFSLNGFKQTFLYYAVIKESIDSMSEIGHLRVFKVRKNDLADTVLMCTKNIDFLHEDFDYRKFWKKFLRKKGCN